MSDICSKLAAWADAAGISGRENNGRLAVVKSCLLDRLINAGEKGPSQTPCPYHKGRWAGVSWGWPDEEGKTTKATGFGAIIGPPVEVSPFLQAAYDAGCRCYQHKCGCTTGWQPDEHCGCLLP